MRLSNLKICLTLICTGFLLIGSADYNFTVYTIGDSTMSIFSLPDLRVGWGQVLPHFFSNDVKVVDAAKSGRSSKSFIDEGYWTNVINQVNNGDYVVIQFGHNDEKTDTARHTDPYTTYTANLKKFVDETRAKGGYPILCTPIVRRYFNSDGTVRFSHGNYPDAVRKLAVDENIPMVDMELKTKALVESYGPDSSKQLYNYVDKGVSSYYPNGNSDDTHLNSVGAEKVAALFVEGIIELNLDLTSYIITGINSDNKLPVGYSLSQNYPNPFNPTTTIRYSIPNDSQVKINIYNILGKKEVSLVDKEQTSGKYVINFNAEKLASGIYFYRIEAGSFVQTKKMLFLK